MIFIKYRFIPKKFKKVKKQIRLLAIKENFKVCYLLDSSIRYIGNQDFIMCIVLRL
jgi:hypothetical protein